MCHIPRFYNFIKVNKIVILNKCVQNGLENIKNNIQIPNKYRTNQEYLNDYTFKI